MNLEQTIEASQKLGKKAILWGGSFFILAIVILNSFTTIDSSESVRIQNNFTGGYEWHTTEGIKLKFPFFSRVHVYNSVSTVAVTDDDGVIESASISRPPLPITFADNYGGQLEASWRVKLPTSPEQLERFHQDVKGQENFEGNTLLTFARDMLNLTSDQFLAQDFMQGGKGAFKQRLEDQGDNGMLVTKREKVLVQGQVADQNSTTKSRDQGKTAKQFVYKVVIQRDSEGKPLRREHSLDKYGVTVFQTDLGEFTPAPDLVQYVTTVKTRERERASVVANQNLERDKAVTEQLRGDRERITVKNTALKEKARAVIEAEKRVELATLQAEQEVVERSKVADLAVIDKNRELQIAKANEGIQKANAVAAKYEGNAIKEVGFAQAAVEAAKLKAKTQNKAVFLGKLEADVQLAVAKALPHVKIDTPDNVITIGQTNGQNGQSAVSDLLSTKLVQDLVRTK